MEVKFHLPGLRQNYPLNMLILSLMEQKPEFFRKGIQIASFFGEFPASLWNGGRPSNYDQCDADYVRNVVKNINAKGIPIRYTYTNMLLNEEDCRDPYCNFCMQVADNGMNGVIVFSPVLERYIRENYPGYRLNSSTCKEIRDIRLVNEELKKDYHLVVLDYNFNNRFEELDKIEDKERCEILVNAVCIPDCPRRGEHYKNIARNQRIMLKNRKLPADKQIPLENTERKTVFIRFRITALIFHRRRSGRNMCRWASAISRSKEGQPISSLWSKPTVTIWFDRNIRDRRESCF